MEGRTVRERLEGRELKVFCVFSMALLLAAGFVGMWHEDHDRLAMIRGLWTIVVSRDALITDYFELAGYGAAFLNAMLVMGMGLVLLRKEDVRFVGITMAAVFINVGYALWGKNPVNILPILLGFLIYARVQKARFSRYIYTAFFGTSLAPLMTELLFILPFNKRINLPVAIAVGALIGFILPSLSMHTASMHMGYNLFNVGFSAGIVAFAAVCVLNALGIESESMMIWRSGRPLWVGAGLCIYFLLTFLYGWYLNRRDIKGLFKIWKHPGRAVADFVLMEGAGPTLMNMAVTGLVCVAYIYLIGGDLSGPVVGAILTAFGFSAFGAHTKNFLPVLLGVFLSTFVNQFTPVTPGMQLAAVFAVGLCPIAGRFGPIAGIVAGMLHAAIVMCTSRMYGGLNLYNNGFSAGWVAIIMVPVLESFVTGMKERRGKKEEKQR